MEAAPRLRPRAAAPPGVAARIARLDWPAIETSLWERGWARSGAPVLTPPEGAVLAALYDRDARFRSRVDMQRHRFGAGEYKYFARPLPPLVRALRERLYARLAPVANGWMEALRARRRYPGRLSAFLAECRQAGQTKPTPLLLRYEAGGYNCMHQDLYGEIAFPLQATFVLSDAGSDYTGGAFLLVEQHPRRQSRAEAIDLTRGEMILFANRERPVRGRRGHYRAVMRHGVSTVLTGTRITLGIIFHDAR